MANDWFTRTTWNEADQADYFARLKRSRTPYHKAQYLWVQARELDRVGLTNEATTLLDKMLAEFPEPFFLPLVCMLKAEILIKYGNLEEAMIFYRRALDVERKHPNHRTHAVYDFGKLVVENKITQFYDEALAVLDEMEMPGTKFPAQVYKENGIRALIAAHKKQLERAKGFAQVALKAAYQNDSGFRRHRKFGLVKDRETEFYDAIEAIANSDTKSFSN